MSGVAIALVLSAAVVHAVWNRMLHGSTDRLATATVGTVVGAVLLLPAAIAAPPARAWPLVLLSGAAEAAYFLLLTAAYQRGELSLTYPVARGVAPFLVTLGGAVVLGQVLDAARVGGSLTLGLGLAVISQVGLAKGRGRAMMFAGLTGLAIATYSVIDARAVRVASPVGYLGAVMAVAAMVLLVAARPGWQRLRAAAPTGAGVGVGTIAAYLLVLFAFQRAPAAPVATLRELSIVFGVLIARDRPGKRVWLGAALCVLGAALVVL
ncbi:MAG TPA: EamA family transporter [Streptosporangiaceae bacterium]|nr:EamA family transporter [Streptosporangiaceae bacterium]